MLIMRFVLTNKGTGGLRPPPMRGSAPGSSPDPVPMDQYDLFAIISISQSLLSLALVLVELRSCSANFPAVD